MAKGRAKAVRPLTPLQQAKQLEPDVFGEMDALAKRYGAGLFRIVGQRYFERRRKEERLREQIAVRERELEQLRQQAGR